MVIYLTKKEGDYLKKILKNIGFNVQEFGLTENPAGIDGNGSDALIIKSEKIFNLINRTVGNKINNLKPTGFMSSIVRAKAEKVMNDLGIDFDWFVKH